MSRTEIRPSPKGVNTRDNDITRDDSYATDALNVIKDHQGHIVTRNGYEVKYDRPDFDTESTVDLVSREGKTVRIDSDSLYVGDSGIFTEVVDGFASGSFEFTEIDSCQYNKNLYLTEASGESAKPMMKYDGGMYYRAGLPKPIIDNESGLSPGTDLYYRMWFGHKDQNGQITYGDYHEVIIDSTPGANVQFDIEPLKDTFFDDLYFTTAAVPQQDIGVVGGVDADTINVSEHNLIVGQFVNIIFNVGALNLGSVSHWLKVTAASVNSLTFDITPIKEDNRFGDDPDNRFARLQTSSDHSNTTLFISSSESLATSFYISPDLASSSTDDWTFFSKSWKSGSSSTQTLIMNVGIQDTFMEDFYDTSVLKGLPPKFKYCKIFNNIMVGFGSAYGDNVNKPDGTDPLYNQEGYDDQLYFSDIGLGSSVETFPPFNAFPIGNSEQGEATGLYANQDYLLAFKERAVYSIIGDLVNTNYRVSDVQSSGIGCISHKSIVQIENGCTFVSPRGVHLIAGSGKPVEVSEDIQTKFTDTLPGGLDFRKCRAAIDYQQERYLLWVPYLEDDGVTYDYTRSEVFAYDYYRKEWWIWDNIDARNGLNTLVDEYNNYRIKFSNGTDILEFNDGFNDSGTAINDYYITNWENLGSPSLTKSFIDFKVFSLLPTAWKAKISTQVNWDESSYLTKDEVKDVSTTDAYVKQGLDRCNVYSLRFKVANGVLNQKMCITAIEYEYSLKGSRMKD